MRIVVAPDSFKGSMSAGQVAAEIADAIDELRPDADVDCCPMADGGEGTLDVLLDAHHGQRRRVACHGPRGEPITADVGLIAQASTAVVELAAAAGLTLVPPAQRDPLSATTFGVGELIGAALDAQVDRIILALGGSATVDGGAGLAQALGLRLLDSLGNVLPSPISLRDLPRARSLDPTDLLERIRETEIVIAADVLNPLLGPDGAPRVFGPQKGADPAGVAQLEAALSHWVGLLEGLTGRALRDEPGVGAAGGAALPLLAFAQAQIVLGADLVMQAVELPRRVTGANLVITGEGRLDRQSLMGKVVGSVARLARAAGVRCAAVVGSLGPGHEEVARRLDAVASLTAPGEDAAAAIRDPRGRLRAAVAKLL